MAKYCVTNGFIYDKGVVSFIKILYLNPRMLLADECKTLTDDETYYSVVYLGKNENPDNWHEIDRRMFNRKRRNKHDI